MGIVTKCDHCDAAIPEIEDIVCERCRTAKCSTCKTTIADDNDVYCETCAKAEFETVAPSAEETLGDLIDIRVVHDLAAAIRAGNRDDAEYHLDRLTDNVGAWKDQVELGRYSPAAKRAA